MSVVHRQVRRALAERTVDTHEAFLCLRLCTFSRFLVDTRAAILITCLFALLRSSFIYGNRTL